MKKFGCKDLAAARDMTNEDVLAIRRELAGLTAAVSLEPGKYPMGKIRKSAAEKNLRKSGLGGVSRRAGKMMRRVA